MKSGLSTAAGAAAALGIIFALGVWFYRLGDSDARSVPIIRADAGPTKKIPDDPGGEKTPHQGIKSYEAASGGAATAGAAVIAAAPPEPRPGDVAMGRLAPVGKPGAGAAGRPDPAPARAVDAPERPDAAPRPGKAPDDGDRLAAAPDAATLVPERPRGRPATAPADRPADRPGTDRPGTDLPATAGAGATPAADAAAGDKPAAVGPAADDDRPAVPDEELVIPGATEYAPDASPQAPRRPGNLAERHKAAAEVAVEERRDLVAEAARSAVQIQLVADPDRDAVVRLWQKIYRENIDILQGRALAVQSIVSGGVTWYRLRVGPFKSRAEAASVCQALKARSQDCIVSRNT